MAACPVLQFPLEFAIGESDNNTAIVRCQGRLTSETVRELKALVKPMFQSYERVSLDLSGLQYMDSSGLAALVALYTSAISSGHCKLQVQRLSQPVRELLRITKLLSIFEPCSGHL